MIKKVFCQTTLLILSIFFCSQLLYSQQLAFPSAEGYGKYTTGGRGGKVIEVTNLNASGAGSFAAAVAESGARTIVFRVAGTIDADINIKKGDITIAGQTAPGDGITLKGTLGISASNVIIRYIRIRAEKKGDAIGGRYNDNIIIDHVSASWSEDETMSIYHGNNVTIQWCMITEAMGGEHAFGGIWGNNHSTYHHNLFAHNVQRNPRIASGAGFNDFRNNVIYNWESHSIYGGEKHQGTDSRFQSCSTNVVANYLKPGPGTLEKDAIKICSPWSRDRNGGDSDWGKWYVAGNVMHGNDSITADNWMGVVPVRWTSSDVEEWQLDKKPLIKLDEPTGYMPINQQSAEEAYLSVLEKAGCSLPNRDAVDIRIIDEVRNGTATYGKGYVTSASTVGGWPKLNGGTASIDTDHDGMPDEWETANGLNINDPEDRNGIAENGYTNLEIYLNSLVKNFSSFYSPINVNAKLTDITAVELGWKGTNADETGFRIEREKNGSGVYDTIAEVKADITSFVDSGLDEFTTYRYRISAFNDSLTSGYGEIVSVVTLGKTTLPLAVDNPSPKNNSSNVSVDTLLMWSSSLNATSYDIYLGTENPPPFIINQENTGYKAEGLETGTYYYWRIDAKNDNGVTEGSIWRFKVEGIKKTGINSINNEYITVHNFPNPFNKSTTIQYELKKQTRVELHIYNVMGKKISTLVNENQDKGEHIITFDAGNLVSGIYIYKLRTDSFEQRGRMLLMK